MRFHTLVFRNLSRKFTRTALTLIALSVAVASVVALRGIAKGFTRSFADIYRTHAVDIVVSRQGTADRLSSSVGEDAIQKIAALSHVNRAAGVLLETLSLEEQQVFGIPTMGIETGNWLRDDYDWIAKATAIDPNAKQLSLGSNLANRVGLSAGQTTMIFEEPFFVAGVFESRSVWENGSMIMPLDQLQRLTDRTGQVTYINVVLDSDVNSSQADDVVVAIESIDDRLHALPTEQFVGSDTRMKLASAMAWMTSVISLAIGAIGTLNTMMTSVLERTREIGVLRAVGWPRGRIVRMILAEAFALSLLATAIGSLLAYAACAGLSQHPAASGILVPTIDTATYLEGGLLAVLIGLTGAIIPAFRAASVSPTLALGSAD
ncbi:ABC transporter permease [Rhodopirellula sp. MGV]|uniref:ABC transporter permease n=1 Tax=Rhodopirellula sp. MGV TaxID=2023130 RepID=UPI000B972756|nr:ABC transporter permease [Rhodopirellula sp. MGV]OYP36660.1 ABC transporter substrate-binding protein [Rhodopirellula sp. MGV]PNY36089.1 ABC transporter permease [Rhodopirellula baltica]PNY36119.1 ABC transporter permease [Rhodopirellula baltica]